MKKNVFLLAALAVTLFTGCKDDTSQEIESGVPATIELTLQGTNVGTKTAAALPSAEDQINRIVVGVFKSTGTATDSDPVDVISEQTYVSAAVTLAATAGDRSIIVIANAPAGAFAGVTTRGAFLAKTVALGVGVVSTNLPMSGEATTLDGGTVKIINLDAAKPTNSAFVKLSRLVARVSIASVKFEPETTGQYNGATFTLDHIFLYNAVSTSKVGIGGFDTTTPAADLTSYLSNGWNGTTLVSYLGDAESPAVSVTSSTAYTSPHYFYTFPNENTTTRTKLIISGTFTPKDGTGVIVYYPIVINKAQEGTTGTTAGLGTVARNTTYALTATIKSKGVTDITTDINPAALSLTVSVAPWALNITQDVVFN